MVPVKPASGVKVPRLRSSLILAVLTVAALAVSAGFWYWSAMSKDSQLSLASGVELKYRADMIGILRKEAEANELEIQVQPIPCATDAIAQVDRGELDAAVIPAGLAVKAANVRQVAMLDCEALHLFVKPELLAQGVAGLHGKRIYLGAPGSGVRIIAEEILKFMQLKPENGDYQAESYTFADLSKLMATSPDALPDAIFGLSPLPSPLAEKLVHQCGYQLMELPVGEAMALRQAYIEDLLIPANTYGVHPAVPEKPLHTVGTRAVLIANVNVPKLAIRRLLEVLYESDFARRVGIKPLNPDLLQRSGEYPNHPGTVAYLHRNDPLFNKDRIDGIKSFAGTLVSAVSALILAWQWYKRRRVAGVDDYLRACNKLELDALDASSRGALGEAELQAGLAQLGDLKIDVLEKHQQGVFSGDQQFAALVSRIESLQQTLPHLLAVTAGQAGRGAPAAGQRRADLQPHFVVGLDHPLEAERLPSRGPAAAA
jgi:TRAP-type uncharacterized transport system substrate-binding protein